MRKESFEPKNFQVSIQTNKTQDKIVLKLLDLRLPAGTEVEAEETSTYSMTPQYFSDEMYMVSTAYLAQIVKETLLMDNLETISECECHVYTAYTILPSKEVSAYWQTHHIHMHTGIPRDWRRCHAQSLQQLYRVAEKAIEKFLSDLQNGSYTPYKWTLDYIVPDVLIEDYKQAQEARDQSIDGVWNMLRRMSDPNAVAGMKELNKMIGMAGFKSYIHQLICDVQIRRMRSMMGLREETKVPMHFVFTGNPGTGKTTAAKALGKALHEAGIISRGDVVYRDRSTLVGAHVGESETMVKELFEKDAPGNVVVIDEAYTLTADKWAGDFGHRVVDSLMTYTADPKADYVVVLCGYRKEMDQLLSSNMGLGSRFSLRFDFEDFTHEQLMELTHSCLTEMDYHFTPQAEAAYSTLLSEVLREHPAHFGNARWVKAAIHQHILEALHHRQTLSLTRGAVQLTREFFSTIEQEDVLAVADQLRRLNSTLFGGNAPRRIGFAA